MTTSQIKRELLECPVCHDSYDERARTPRLPPCRHTHCSICLTELLRSGQFKCTLCNAIHVIRNGDIENIPKDNTLRQLMDIMNRKETQKCDACAESGTTIIAVCYCEVCEEHFCQECAAAHRRVRITKSHTLRDLIPKRGATKVEPRLNTCTEINHEDEALDLFCESCHKPVCSRCILQKHKDHNISPVNEMASKKQEELLNLIRDLEHVSIDSRVTKLHKIGIKLKQNSQQLKTIISKQFEQYTNAIAEKCRMLHEDADRKTTGKVEELDHTVDMLENHKQVLSSNLSEAQALLQCNDSARFIKDSYSIIRRIKESQTVLQNHVVTTDLHFIQACTAEDFNKIVNALGTIDDSEHAPVIEDSTDDQTEANDTTNGQLVRAESDAHLSFYDLHPGQFLEVLKSLLSSENAVENNGLIQATGGTPELDDHGGNPESANVMENLKDCTDVSKTVKECIPRGKLDIIGTATVRQMVAMRFETLKLRGSWTIDADMLIVRSVTSDEAEMCMEILVETVLEDKVPLPRGSEIIVDTDKWQIVNNRLNKKYKDQVKVEVLHPSNSVGIYATCTSALNDARDTVRIFLRDNLIKCVTLEFHTEVVGFVMRQKGRLKKVRESYSQYFVSVTRNDGNKIEVKGIGYGLCSAVRLVQGLAARFKGNTGVDDGDDGERFDSDDEADDEEEERFSDDEATNEATINVGVNMTLMLPDIETPIKALCLPGDDRVIFAVVGDITTLPVEAVINPANQTLKHNGGVSKILVEKGGASIQDECRNHVSRNGNVPIGDIYSSRAGNLPFSTIIHAVGPKWIDGSKQEREMLYALVTKCLQEASRKQLATIAVPAIGTGANKFPQTESTNIVTRAVRDFLTTYPRTCISEIYFCHISLDIVDDFSRSLCQYFKEGDIVLSHPHNHTAADSPNVSTKEAIMRQFIF